MKHAKEACFMLRLRRTGFRRQDRSGILRRWGSEHETERNLIMNNTKLRTALFLHIIIVLMEIIVTNYVYATRNGLEMFYHYTEVSNFMCLLCSGAFVLFMLPALSKGRTSGFVSTYMMQHYKGNDELPAWLIIARYVVVCSLMLTFFIVLTVLGPKNGFDEVLLKGVHPMDHLLVPLMSLFSFLFLENKTALPKAAPFWALVPTVIYAVTMLILNAARITVGPYFFLRIYEQSVFKTVMWVVVVMGINYLLSWLVMKVYNGRIKTKQQ